MTAAMGIPKFDTGPQKSERIGQLLALQEMFLGNQDSAEEASLSSKLMKLSQ